MTWNGDVYEEGIKLNIILEQWTEHYYKGTSRKAYDGDIVKLWNGNKTFISYFEGYPTISSKHRIITYGDWYGMMYLGNIHENPELLKVKK